MKQERLYQFPPIDLLTEPPVHTVDDGSESRDTARKLEEIFASFHIGVKVTEIMQGPTVTRFEIVPDPGIRICCLHHKVIRGR